MEASLPKTARVDAQPGDSPQPVSVAEWAFFSLASRRCMRPGQHRVYGVPQQRYHTAGEQSRQSIFSSTPPAARSGIFCVLPKKRTPHDHLAIAFPQHGSSVHRPIAADVVGHPISRLTAGPPHTPHSPRNAVILLRAVWPRTWINGILYRPWPACDRRATPPSTAV